MWPLMLAVLARHRRRQPPRDAVSTLLASGCRVLASTPPTLISAASISCAVSSPEEGDLFAAHVRRLASEHRLTATVTVDGKRLRARFARQDGAGERPNDAG